MGRDTHKGVATGSYQPQGPPRRPPPRRLPPHNARLMMLATIISTMIGKKMNPIEFPKSKNINLIAPELIEMKIRTSMIQPKRKPRGCCRWDRAQDGVVCPWLF